MTLIVNGTPGRISCTSRILAVAAFAALGRAAPVDSDNFDLTALTIEPDDVYALPVVYVTADSAPVVTATTLAPTATASSDPLAAAVFENASQLSSAIASPSAAASGVSKRQQIPANVCVRQPAGASGMPSDLSASTFATDGFYSDIFINAQNPDGWVQFFRNINASSSASAYKGHALLSSYDVQKYADKCSAINGCNAFNIFFERDPSLAPNKDYCLDPQAVVSVKCAFWGGTVTRLNANNFGQYRASFRVLIAGSNGYVSEAYAAAMPASMADAKKESGQLTKPFTIKTDSGKWIIVSEGETGQVSYSPNRNQATKFALDDDRGLMNLTGSYGFYGNRGTSPNPEILYFSSPGQDYS
ncbi:hypothetical protein KCU61_g8618, partial [Aureobasidium melanogenum]